MLELRDFTKKIETRQVHCSSCYSVGYGKLVYSGHQSDLVECPSCNYTNEIR